MDVKSLINLLIVVYVVVAVLLISLYILKQISINVTVFLLIFLTIILFSIIIILQKIENATSGIYLDNKYNQELLGNVNQRYNNFEEKRKKLGLTACAVYPINGQCSKPFRLVNGCCITDTRDKSFLEQTLTLENLIYFATLSVADDIIELFAKKLLVPGAKYSAKLVSRLFIKVSTSVGVKTTAAASTAVASKASTMWIPGVGWAFAAFEAADFILTAGDWAGFNLDVSYETMIMLRNHLLAKYREDCFKQGVSTKKTFPPSFNIFLDDLYTIKISNEHETNYELWIEILTTLTQTYTADIKEFIKSKDKQLYDKYENYISPNFENEQVQINLESMTDNDWNKWGIYTQEWTNSESGSVIRDKYIFTYLKLLLKQQNRESEMKYYQLWEGISGDFETRCAVSLSEEGAKRYNKKNENLFKSNFSYFNPDDNKKDAYDLVVTCTDTILVPTGKQIDIKEQNGWMGTKITEMTSQKLSAKGCFHFPVGSLWSYCEGVKDGGRKLGRDGVDKDILNMLAGQTSLATIDPYGDGVRFNTDDFTCKYTKFYCEERMLKEYDKEKHSCKMLPGQDFAEALFSPTIVRGVVKAAKIIGNVFGANCPTQEERDSEEDNDRLLTNGECCRDDYNCNNKYSCQFCKYGHKYVCVGNSAEGSTNKKFCGSSRRCKTKSEKDEPDKGAEDLGKCIAGGLIKFGQGFGDAANAIGDELGMSGKKTWDDGTYCFAGTSCRNCKNNATWWSGIGKDGMRCGKQPCWGSGTVCGAGTTCNKCCDGQNCPWYQVGVCTCK